MKPKPERVQIPEADDGIIYSSEELSHLDHSRRDSGTGIDPSIPYGVNFVRARDAGPSFTKEEWMEKIGHPHIDPPLKGLEKKIVDEGKGK